MSGEPPDPLPILLMLGISNPKDVSRVIGGADTVIWRVEEAERVSALRLFRPEQTAMVRREVAAMTTAYTAGLPVPHIRAEGIWRARPALLLSWMPGRTLLDELRASPWRAWPLGVRFGRMHAALHAITAPPELASDAAAWIEWAEPNAELRECLRAGTGDHAVLLHLDYHPMNVLIADGQVSAVLDWANARAGDPRADLARTVSILHFAPLDLGLPRAVTGLVRRVFVAGWRHGYRDVASPVSGMAPFYAWAGMVMIRDLSPRLGRADLPWLTPGFLEGVRRWVDAWWDRAGCGKPRGVHSRRTGTGPQERVS